MINCNKLVIQNPVDLSFELSQFNFIYDDELVSLLLFFIYKDQVKGIILNKASNRVYSNDGILQKELNDWLKEQIDSNTEHGIHFLEGHWSFHLLIDALFKFGYIDGNSIDHIILSIAVIKDSGGDILFNCIETRNVVKAVQNLLLNIIKISGLNIDITTSKYVYFKVLDPIYMGQKLTYNQVFDGLFDENIPTRSDLMMVAKCNHLSDHAKSKLINGELSIS